MTVYFITGANRGIGLALVSQLSTESSNLVIASTRDESKSQELVKLSKSRGNVKIVTLDVGSQSSIDQLPAQLTKFTKGIDVFISNAGILEPNAFNKVLDTERSAWLKHFEINSLGVVFVLKAIYPFLIYKPTKQVILVSSTGGSITNKFPVQNTGYGVSKAALNFIGLSLSQELEGFTIVSIHPGDVSSKSALDVAKHVVNVQPELKPLIDQFQYLTEEESGEYVTKLIKSVDHSYNGKFYNFDGTTLPW